MGLKYSSTVYSDSDVLFFVASVYTGVNRRYLVVTVECVILAERDSDLARV